jgi:hypothetical protein
MKFFENMDGREKLMAVGVISGAVIIIVYIIASALLGKAI